MLLCDAAEQQGGKLYILGAGWSTIHFSDVPVNMALAVKLAVPWDQANEAHRMKAALLTEDGEPVDVGAGPVHAEGDIEVGRPPGLKRGTPLDVPFVLPFPNLVLPAGGYVWELEIDGTQMARTPFRVLDQRLPGGPQ